MPMRAKTARTKRGSTRRAKISSRAKTAKLAAPTKKAVQAIVAKAINRASETKFVSSYAADTTPNTYTSFNSAISGTGQWSSAMPQLAEGSTAYTRDGNLISPRQLKVAVDVRVTGDASGSRVYPFDITGVVYYGYCKKYSKYSDIQANSASLCSDLLRLGGVNGSGAETQSFNGIVSDSHLVINNAVWHLKKKTFRLYKAGGYLNGSPGNGVQNAPNKNLHSFMLDFGSMLPEKVKYDTSGDLLPSDFAPVWTMGYYYNDSTPPDTTAGSGILEYKANRFLTFKDM